VPPALLVRWRARALRCVAAVVAPLRTVASPCVAFGAAAVLERLAAGRPELVEVICVIIVNLDLKRLKANKRRHLVGRQHFDQWAATMRGSANTQAISNTSPEDPSSASTGMPLYSILSSISSM
jgi:hypothetical protein